MEEWSWLHSSCPSRVLIQHTHLSPAEVFWCLSSASSQVGTTEHREATSGLWELVSADQCGGKKRKGDEFLPPSNPPDISKHPEMEMMVTSWVLTGKIHWTGPTAVCEISQLCPAIPTQLSVEVQGREVGWLSCHLRRMISLSNTPLRPTCFRERCHRSFLSEVIGLYNQQRRWFNCLYDSTILLCIALRNERFLYSKVRKLITNNKFNLVQSIYGYWLMHMCF